MEVVIFYTSGPGRYWFLEKRVAIFGLERWIKILIKAIQQNPFEGISKPEALKHNYAGWWSRCISNEHRIVYRVEGQKIIVAQLKFHY